MTTAIDRAKALLKAATLKRNCEHFRRRRRLCDSCNEWEVVKAARREMVCLGFTPDTLAVVVTLADVAMWAARGPGLCHPANKADGADCLKDAADDALAKFEKLFPEKKQ